jgi:methylase of polypeptide subunit release factors
VKIENNNQILPRAGPGREALREKGQFWTPDWVAEAMVRYALAGGADMLFDPAVGAGAFFRAARFISRDVRLRGVEKDPDALDQAEASGLAKADLEGVEIADFVSRACVRSWSAIVANPPYIRHHRLVPELKARLRAFAKRLLGESLDGRAGLHIYFLLRALESLEPDGRLAFIIPADACEGVFAPALWRWITTNYRLEGVVTFTREASPFPNVDTNPVIVLIRKAAPLAHFQWAQCRRAETVALKDWLGGELDNLSSEDLYVCEREIEEGLATGLSRARATLEANGPALGDFAHVLRGIATGANEFFFLTLGQAEQLGIAREFLLPAVGRTRDVPSDEITEQLLGELDERGRPTLLFAPDGRASDQFPAAVRRYLSKGEQAGLPHKALISQRRPWYKMETRQAPPLLFAYLGRRNARFIRNRAGCVPLTGFLCLYPRIEEPSFVESLWQALNHPETLANLALVGKTYGNGAIKVEPRALERLPLSASALSRLKR